MILQSWQVVVLGSVDLLAWTTCNKEYNTAHYITEDVTAYPSERRRKNNPGTKLSWQLVFVCVEVIFTAVVDRSMILAGLL